MNGTRCCTAELMASKLLTWVRQRDKETPGERMEKQSLTWFHMWWISHWESTRPKYHFGPCYIHGSCGSASRIAQPAQHVNWLPSAERRKGKKIGKRKDTRPKRNYCKGKGEKERKKGETTELKKQQRKNKNKAKKEERCRRSKADPEGVESSQIAFQLWRLEEATPPP